MDPRLRALVATGSLDLVALIPVSLSVDMVPATILNEEDGF